MARDVSDFAKIDPAHIVDGLFVPCAGRKRQALDKVGGEWAGGEISFTGVQLGAAEQDVLLAICARTGRTGLQVCGNEKDLLASQLSLSLDEAAADKDLGRVEVTAYSLLLDAGLGTSGRSYKVLLKYLKNLAAVSVYRRVGKVGGASPLIGFKHIGDHFTVAVNWRLTDAIFGHQYIAVSLHERRQIKSEAGRILHTWLSAHIRLGGSLMAGRGVAIDSLIPHVYGRSRCSDKVWRVRRGQIRAALAEISDLKGWVCSLDATGRAVVCRPKLIPIQDVVGTPGEIDEMIRAGNLIPTKNGKPQLS